MTKTCQTIVTVLEWIIGIALALCLFLGGLGFIGFVAAFIAGGDTAANICTFLSKTYYVYLIKASTITTLACFVLQYFKGDAKWKNPFKKEAKAEETEAEPAEAIEATEAPEAPEAETEA